MNGANKFDSYSSGRVQYELSKRNGITLLKVTKNGHVWTLERFAYSVERDRYLMTSFTQEITAHGSTDVICQACYKEVSEEKEPT